MNNEKNILRLFLSLCCAMLVVQTSYARRSTRRARARRQQRSQQKQLNQPQNVQLAQNELSIQKENELTQKTSSPQPTLGAPVPVRPAPEGKPTPTTSPDSETTPEGMGLKDETGKKDEIAKSQAPFLEGQEEFPLELQTSPQPQEQPTMGSEKRDIEFYFENAGLDKLIEQIEEIFNVTFISDDAITPLAKDSKAIKGNKISFKTHRPLNEQEAWDLFLSFLEIAGFGVIKQSEPNLYRILTLPKTRKGALKAFIGTDYEELPDNDQIVRFVYFIQNTKADTLSPIINSLKSPDAPLLVLKEHNAFIITDKSYNIKMLMKIVKELDQVTMPQSMSVLKLRQADAVEVKKLYDSIIQTGEGKGAGFFGARKQPTSLFFPENTRIIAEPRTNSLILLGPTDAIQKIENFIIKNVDIELDQPYSPLHIYQLKFAKAQTIADIMNNVTKFGQNTPAGKSGGVRGIDKFMRPITFIAETETNRLVIKGHYDDYLKSVEIIKQLDEKQPQVGVEVLILNITDSTAKELGAQIRSKNSLCGPFTKNVTWQTSGNRVTGTPSGIVQRTTGDGIARLLGNILDLLSGGTVGGNTVISLGRDACGVWGIFSILDSITNLQVISNPFLVATNKTKAKVSIGEIRRVQTGTIVGGTQNIDTLGNRTANLEVNVTPQINSDGMIILDLEVVIDRFADPNDLTSPTIDTKKIRTQTLVADKEVLALGGLIRNREDDTQTKTPILGDIPILGWLFKNKRKAQENENLLVLISASILEPENTEVNEFTQERIDKYRETLTVLDDSTAKDPVTKWFFGTRKLSQEVVESFIFERSEIREAQKEEAAGILRKDYKKAVDQNKPMIEQVKEIKESNKINSDSKNGIPATSLVNKEIDTNVPQEQKTITEPAKVAAMQTPEAPARMDKATLHEKIKNKKRIRLSRDSFVSSKPVERT